MKRLNNFERWWLIIGVVFLGFGLLTIIVPQSGVIFHVTNGPRGWPVRAETETVSEAGSRAYGVVAVLLGVGIVAASLYREKK